MRTITAVEIGADTCALASTSVRGAELVVAAAATLDPAAFPGIEAFAVALQQTRRSLKLPRRCRVVVWGLPDGAALKDPLVASLVEPLTKAGFNVTRVVTPCNALGALSRMRTSRTGGAMCWLGINRNGVAIVVIRPGKLLYSHSFAWDSNVGATGSQARLLQRYSLVAFLAPEVRRALDAAKQKGTTVDGIVTCGNLPDLRSLTMPLIEELDIEVETLDSLEGLQMKPELAERLSEVAPAIRLACAGAFARETRTVDEVRRRQVRFTARAAAMFRIAVAIGLLAGAAYAWYLYHRPAPTPAAPRAPVKAAVTPTPRTSSAAPATVPSTPTATTKNVTGPPAATPNQVPAALAPAPKNVETPPAGAPTNLPRPAPPTPRPAAPSAPVQTTVPKPVTVPGPTSVAPKSAASAPPSSPPKAPPVATARPPLTVPSTVPTVRPPAPAPPAAPPGRRGAVGLNTQPRTADKPDAPSASRPGGNTIPELLKDPVPRVTAILVSGDRRLASVGDEGQIVGVGDTVGRRVVVSIDERTVVLREPSGVRIRVALGGRVVGVDRGGR